MEREKDPLKIELILAKIFRKLGNKEQKFFREVSRVWLKASLPAWRTSEAVVSIGRYRSLDEFLLLLDIGGNFQAPRIQELPFRQYSLHMEFNIAIPYLKTEKQKAIISKKFWNICGESMDFLEFGVFSVINCRSFIDTMKWILLYQCPELKELKLCGDVREGLDAVNDNDHLLLEVPEPIYTAAADKLTSLTIGVSVTEYTDERKLQALFEMTPNLKKLLYAGRHNIMSALVSSTQRMRNAIKLEALEFYFPSTFDKPVEAWDSLLQYVQTVRPPLRKVLFHDWEFLMKIREAPFYFYQFLELNRNILTNLELGHLLINDLWLIELTGRYLPELRHLRLDVATSSWRKDNKMIKFDFRALCGVPQLKTLLLSNKWNRGEGWGEYLTENELKYEGEAKSWMVDEIKIDYHSLELEHMEEFHFDMYRRLGEQALRKMGKMMKNLKRLKVVVTEDTFLPIINLIWPNLEELSLLKGSNVSAEAIQNQRLINKTTRIVVDA